MNNIGYLIVHQPGIKRVFVGYLGNGVNMPWYELISLLASRLRYWFFFHLWLRATLGYGNAMAVRELQILFFTALFGDLNCRQLWHFLAEESSLGLFVHYTTVHH
jgi:hypothetical protein